MKKIIISLAILIIGIATFGQSTTFPSGMSYVTSAASGDTLMIANGSGAVPVVITKANFLIDYATLASPTFTGTMTFASPFTLGSTSVTATGTEMNYLVGVTSSIQTQLDAKLNVADSVSLIAGTNITLTESVTGDSLTISSPDDVSLTDTMLYVSWTVGQGNAGDTALFSVGDVLAGLKWEGSHSLVITKVTAVVHGTTPDVDLALLHDANFRDATPTAVLTTDLTVTNTTTGVEATSFSSATIASGQWLYVRVDQATAQATQCVINIYGYLQ